MALKVKSTVKPRCLTIAAAVANAATECRLEMDILITSGTDGKHMENSLHYTGDALDIRSRNLNNIDLTLLTKVIQRRLGKNYQVIVENRLKANEHIHIEYDPT